MKKGLSILLISLLAVVLTTTVIFGAPMEMQGQTPNEKQAAYCTPEQVRNMQCQQTVKKNPASESLAQTTSSTATNVPHHFGKWIER